MATRVCPECKAQYVASVRRCIDCDVLLVEEAADQAGASAAPVEASSGGQLAYELEGWGNQLRQSLAGMLDLAGVPFVWEAGTLVVPASFEAEVDACIAAVEGGEAEELPDDAELVAFDIEGVSAEELDELDAVLVAQHIAHSWDETGALLVAADREEEVAALIEEVLDASGSDDGDDGGFALHSALDGLYVAVDKLVKDLADAKLARRYLEASSGLDGLGVPYGLAGDDWQALLDAVASLDDAVVEIHPQLERAPSSPDVEDDDDAEDGEAEAEGDEVEAEDGEVGAEDGDVDADGSVPPGERAASLAKALRERLRELI